jgi:hypothetical protein
VIYIILTFQQSSEPQKQEPLGHCVICWIFFVVSICLLLGHLPSRRITHYQLSATAYSVRS